MTTDKFDEVVRKAQAMLRLIEHPNTPENEVDNAMRILHSMLNKYQLSISEIKSSNVEVNEDIAEHVIDPQKKNISVLESNLLTILTEHHNCKFIIREGFDYRGKKVSTKYVIIGHKSDRIFVEWLFLSIGINLTNRFKQFSKKYKLGHGSKSYRSSFFLGAIDEIDKRFKEMNNESQANTTALVLVKQKNVDDFVGKRYPNLKSHAFNQPNIEYSSYLKGKEAGKTIALNRPVEDTTESVLKLG